MSLSVRHKGAASTAAVQLAHVATFDASHLHGRTLIFADLRTEDG